MNVPVPEIENISIAMFVFYNLMTWLHFLANWHGMQLSAYEQHTIIF